MAKRKRTREQNAATYARRKQRAINRGYTGYNQQRISRRISRRLVDRMIERMTFDPDYDWTNLDQDDPEYWIWFRIEYNKEGAPA